MSADHAGRLPAGGRPSSRQVLLGGAIAQVAVVAVILGGSIVSGDRLGSLAGWYLLGIVVLMVALTGIPAALLVRGRWRGAAALAILLGVVVLLVTEFALATLVLPVSLFLAAGLVWREHRGQ